MGVLAGGGVGGEAAAVRGGGGGRVEVGGDRAQPALRGVVHWRRDCSCSRGIGDGLRALRGEVGKSSCGSERETQEFFRVRGRV